MAEATVNGVRLAYDVHGEGEPVLLICATGQPAFSWSLSQVPALTGAGYQVITFDNRGWRRRRNRRARTPCRAWPTMPPRCSSTSTCGAAGWRAIHSARSSRKSWRWPGRISYRPR